MLRRMRADSKAKAASISREVAWIGLDELASGYPVDAQICEVGPEAMISAYNAMARAICDQRTGHRRASPCVLHENEG